MTTATAKRYYKNILFAPVKKVMYGHDLAELIALAKSQSPEVLSQESCTFIPEWAEWACKQAHEPFLEKVRQMPEARPLLDSGKEIKVERWGVPLLSDFGVKQLAYLIGCLTAVITLDETTHAYGETYKVRIGYNPFTGWHIVAKTTSKTKTEQQLLQEFLSGQIK